MQPGSGEVVSGEAGPGKLVRVEGRPVVPLIPRVEMGMLQKVVVLGGNGFVGTLSEFLQQRPLT